MQIFSPKKKSCQNETNYLQISRSRHGSVIRLKETTVAKLWALYKQEANIVKYFPDKFLKRVPPVKYFWHVLAVEKTNVYKEILQKKLKELKEKRGTAEEKIRMSNDMKALFESLDSTVLLDTLCKIKSK